MDGNPIVPMQGFFVHTKAAFSLKIPASAKLHSLSSRFKGTASVPSVLLKFENSGNIDETMVRFDDKATLSFDNALDARKIFPSADNPSISSIINNVEYAINSVPYPANSIEIPLIISAPSEGSYKISASSITDLPDYNVFLTDNLVGTTVNLGETSDYSFSSVSGKVADRFVLTVSTLTTATPEIMASKTPFNMYCANRTLHIQTLGEDWNGTKGNIRIFDMTGRIVKTVQNSYFNLDEIKQIPLSENQGIYVVEISSGIKRFVGKVVIK